MVGGIIRQIAVLVIALVFALGTTAAPVGATEGDVIELPRDELELPGTCFPGDAFLPAVQFPGDAFGGTGHDILETFPPGGVNFPGDAFASTPGGAKVCGSKTIPQPERP